jgi:hypothetical protein
MGGVVEREREGEERERERTIASCPLFAAKCKGDLASGTVSVCTLAPAANNAATTCTCPISDDMLRGEVP